MEQLLKHIYDVANRYFKIVGIKNYGTIRQEDLDINYTNVVFDYKGYDPSDNDVFSMPMKLLWDQTWIEEEEGKLTYIQEQKRLAEEAARKKQETADRAEYERLKAKYGW